MDTRFYEILGLFAYLEEIEKGGGTFSRASLSSHNIKGGRPFCGGQWSVEQDYAPHKQLRAFENQRLQDTVISGRLNVIKRPKQTNQIVRTGES
jgi:hypothetical protein